MGIEVRLLYRRSTIGGGGGQGYNAAPPCVIDECNGVSSNKIYHCEKAKFTLIFNMRKHNCNLLSGGILRQHTMNRCGNKP